MRSFARSLSFFLALLIPEIASTAAISAKYFDQFNSPFMEVIKEDSDVAREEQPVYPIWTRSMTWEWLKYRPKSEDDAKTPECNSLKWLESNRQGDAAGISKSISQYVKNCESQIQSDFHLSPMSTYLTMMIQWDQKNYPYGHLVLFHLPNGNLLKGFLALKGDGKPRPLIIMRLGIFANVTTFAPERFMFLQLFEQSPFNVLVLESNSSKEYVFRNKNLSLGGFDEGIQNYLIAKNLQKSGEPLSAIVSGVHLTAMSMGGHGVLFSSLINEWDFQKQNSSTAKPVIGSVFAYCPLVNFRDTMDYHLAEGVVPIGMNYWVSSRLHGIEKILPGIDEKNFVESMVTWIEKNYQGPAAYDGSIPLDVDLKANLKKFWYVNQYWPFYKNIETPVMILATKTDPIVPFQVNSQRLQNKYMDIGKSTLSVVDTENGLHCNYPGSYRWRPMASIVQAFFLRQSQFKTEKMSRSLDLSPEEMEAVRHQGLSLPLEINEGKNSSEFFVTLKLSEKPPMLRSANFRFDDIGFAETDFAASKDLLKRWFDQNLNFDLVESSTAAPKLILTWYR